jgi:hypothetical protein
MATIIIELEITGGAANAHYAVNKVLDTGILQDAIKEHGLLRVTSATCHAKPAEKAKAKKSRRTRRS